MSDYLFAYGFLKTQFQGNKQTQTPDFDREFIGNGLYTGEIYMVNIYPGVIYNPSLPPTVKGEIFKLGNPEKTLHELDQYEHSAPLILQDPDYNRILRPIYIENQVLQCWVYEYLREIDPSRIIPEGEFIPIF